MKASVVRKGKALAKRLYRIAMKYPVAQREGVAQMALFESNESLPALYRLLRSKGYSMLSSLEKSYGAYLSYSKGGLGTENDDLDPLLDQLMTEGTSGAGSSPDTASTQTSEDRAWGVESVLDAIDQAWDTATDIGGQIYDWATGAGGGMPEPEPTPAAPVIHNLAPGADYIRRYAASGKLNPYQAPGAPGSTGVSVSPMSPTTIALGVGAAVLLGYALLGKKGKKGKK